MVGKAKISRQFLALSVLPLCVFLMSLGMRVPNLASLCSSPKPRPRAVIERVSKAAQTIAVKKGIPEADAEGSDPVAVPLPPEAVPICFSHCTWQFQSVTPPTRSARAPPTFCC
jgi:hypothetical protein